MWASVIASIRSELLVVMCGLVGAVTGCSISADLAGKACSAAGECSAGFVCVDGICLLPTDLRADDGGSTNDSGPQPDARADGGSVDTGVPAIDAGPSEDGGLDAGPTDGGVCGGPGQVCCPGDEENKCGDDLSCIGGVCSCNEFLAANEFFTCVLRADKDVECVGHNAAGQLGIGTSDNTARPIQVQLQERTEFVAAGAFHTCAMSVRDDLFCWGENRDGQLGFRIEGSQRFLTPLQVMNAPEGGFELLSLGSFHSCGVTSRETAWCWGRNTDGQAGVVWQSSADSTIYTPTQVLGFSDNSGVKDIAAGAFHTCALESGSVWCWGSNRNRQLGWTKTPTVGASAVPLRTPIRDARRVVSGDFHSCALRDDQTIWCWGRNQSGELGLGFTGGPQPPSRVMGDHRFVDLQAMDEHTCGITADEELYCWGRNRNGELGLGVMDEGRTVPTLVPIGPVYQVVGGRRHTCALTTGGQVLCFGGVGLGELGLGEPTQTATPTRSLLGCPE